LPSREVERREKGKKPFSAGKNTLLSRNVEICIRFHVENISKIYERFQLHDIVSPWQSSQTQQSKPRKGRNIICIEEDVWTFVVKDVPLLTYLLFRYSDYSRYCHLKKDFLSAVVLGKIFASIRDDVFLIRFGYGLKGPHYN
jgi:hypothetical protein